MASGKEYRDYIEYDGKKQKFASVRFRLDKGRKAFEKKHNIKIDKRGIANTMRKLARQHVLEYYLRFDKEISPEGKKWKKLKNPKRYKEGKKILVSQEEKIHMRNSIEFRATAEGIKVWSKDPKADLHQYGVPNRRRGGTLPARPFMGLSKDEKKKYAKEIKNIYTKQIKLNIKFEDLKL